MWAWRDDDADNKLNLDLKHTYKRVSSRKYNLIKLAGSTASQAGSRDALVYAFLALVICTLYMWQDFVLSKTGWVKKANPPVPMIIIWFRSRAATVILVCCFHDPRVAYLTNQKGSDVKIATQYDTKQISNTFHEKRVMFGGFDLLANHPLVLFYYFDNLLY